MKKISWNFVSKYTIIPQRDNQAPDTFLDFSRREIDVVSDPKILQTLNYRSSQTIYQHIHYSHQRSSHQHSSHQRSSHQHSSHQHSSHQHSSHQHSSHHVASFHLHSPTPHNTASQVRFTCIIYLSAIHYIMDSSGNPNLMFNLVFKCSR